MSEKTDGRTAWLWSLRLLFVLEALTLALVLPRIPDIKNSLDLSASDLGLALFGIPCGALFGFLIAPRTVRLIGQARTAWISVAFLAVTFVPVALAGSLKELFLALATVGLGIAHTEISLNGQAVQFERATGRSIMSSSHGFWSVGSIGGVLIGGVLAELATPLLLQSVLAATLLTGGAIIAGRNLRDTQNGASTVEVPRFVATPSMVLLPICLMPVGVMASEGVFMDWSAVFLREELGANPFQASLGFAGFSFAMAVVRLAGDRVIDALGEQVVMLWSACLAGIGTALFAVADAVALSVLGGLIAGAGAAAVYPIALSAAGRMPGRSEDNIAAASLVSFLLLLGSPAIFGFVVENVGGRLAFFGCALLAIPTFAIAASIKLAPARTAEQA